MSCGPRPFPCATALEKHRSCPPTVTRTAESTFPASPWLAGLAHPRSTSDPLPSNLSPEADALVGRARAPADKARVSTTVTLRHRGARTRFSMDSLPPAAETMDLTQDSPPGA